VHTLAEKKSPNALQNVTRRNRATREAIASITLHYGDSGNISLPPDLITMAVSEARQFSTAQIPVTLTSPVTFDDLEVTVSPSLRDVPISLVQENSKVFLVVPATYENISKGDIGDEVGIRSAKYQSGASLPLTIKESSASNLSPTSLQFRCAHKETDTQTATAILRVRQETHSPDTDMPKPWKEPKLEEVNVDGAKVDKALSKPTVRLMLGSPD